MRRNPSLNECGAALAALLLSHFVTGGDVRAVLWDLKAVIEVYRAELLAEAERIGLLDGPVLEPDSPSKTGVPK